MGERNALLADSTFYICFLDDIRRPDILAIVAGSFRLVVTELVMREITRKRGLGGPAGRHARNGGSPIRHGRHAPPAAREGAKDAR